MNMEKAKELADFIRKNVDAEHPFDMARVPHCFCGWSKKCFGSDIDKCGLFPGLNMVPYSFTTPDYCFDSGVSEADQLERAIALLEGKIKLTNSWLTYPQVA